MPTRFLKPAVAIAVILVLAVVLNPSPKQHRVKIKEAVAERSPLAGTLGVGALTAFASTYHSVGIGSYTKVGDHIISYGFLGMVFVAE
jgi:hypothetical protein